MFKSDQLGIESGRDIRFIVYDSMFKSDQLGIEREIRLGDGISIVSSNQTNLGLKAESEESNFDSSEVQIRPTWD